MKDRKSLTVFLVILGVVLLVGVFCYTRLEIVRGTRWKNPAQEVRANAFYALEKWLTELERPVRTLRTGTLDTILNGPEKIIFVEASSINWNKNPELLIPWLEEGSRLLISLDESINYQLSDFIESLGINTVFSYDYKSSYLFEDDDDDDDDNDEEINTLFIVEEENNSETKKTPSFDWSISFEKTKPDAPLKYRTLIMNSKEKTKLIKLEIGKGALFITGEAVFLYNYTLSEPQNISLASDIFQADAPNNGEGILFIRDIGGNQNLFGNLMERGNPAALITSLVMLVIAGFWMTIPLFGRYRPLPEKPGKPLRERFLAEGRFLRKNHALGKYIEIYEKELEQRERSKGILSLAATGNSTAVSNAAVSDAAPSADPGAAFKEITFVQFYNEQKKIMEQLEKEKL